MKVRESLFAARAGELFPPARRIFSPVGKFPAREKSLPARAGRFFAREKSLRTREKIFPARAKSLYAREKIFLARAGNFRTEEKIPPPAAAKADFPRRRNDFIAPIPYASAEPVFMGRSLSETGDEDPS